MPSITQGMERYVRATGAEGADVRIRGRYCREKHILPASARKSTTPQYETVHAVALLLVHCLGGVQTTAVERLHKLWHLPLDNSEPNWSGIQRLSTATRDSLAGLSAGPALAALIEAAINPLYDDDSIFTPCIVTEFTTISVSHKADWIKLWPNESSTTADVWFCAPELRASIPFGTSFKSPFISSTTINSSVILELASLVAQSRIEALHQGVRILTEDACKALNTELPNKNYWRDRLHQKRSSDTSASAEVPENEEANVLPGTLTSSVAKASTDDTHLDADSTTRKASARNAEVIPCVCASSRGIETPSFRTYTNDAYFTPHHLACL